LVGAPARSENAVRISIRGSEMKPKEDSKKKAREITAGSVEDQIRRRAYDLYLEREGGAGSDVEDWLRAEAEVIWSLSH
jgi:Protein of unknown function (DUF2934)